MKIWVTHRFPAYHRWKEAPGEVKFLRNSHRHMFHVKLTIGVNHDDRDLEFFMLQKNLEMFCLATLKNQSDIGSCEMIAERISLWARLEYPKRSFYQVEVSEDGENGAIV